MSKKRNSILRAKSLFSVLVAVFSLMGCAGSESGGYEVIDMREFMLLNINNIRK